MFGLWGRKKHVEAPVDLSRLEDLHKRGDDTPHRVRDRRLDVLSSTSGFQGAKRDRVTQDWNPQPLTPNAIHRMDAKLLRSRARDLVDNNPLAKAGVDAYIANVIECGITPKPTFEDKDRRKQWTDGWNRWGGAFGDPECDITGHQHIYELMGLWLEEVIVGGGCLAHYRHLSRRKFRDRELPLAIELIPEERFVDDKDDFVLFNNRQKGQNQITRGVELDTATGKPVNYWVRTQDFSASSATMAGGEAMALPASQCKYSFFRKRIGQYRGFTLLHAAVMWLWKLGYYTDNELMASAIKSCFAAIISQSSEDLNDFPDLFDGDPDGAVVDQWGNTLEKLQPGIIARMTVPGTVHGVGPNVPPSDTIAWAVFIERCIGIALNLSFEELTRDYSKGNFSSTRASANADRKRFRPMQKFTINHFCMPTYTRFVQAASMRGVDGFPSIDQFASNMSEWLAVRWRTPGWASVNPWDDRRASVLAVENAQSTLENVLGAEGEDWEEVIAQKGREQRAIEAEGLVLNPFADIKEPATDD